MSKASVKETYVVLKKRSEINTNLNEVLDFINQCRNGNQLNALYVALNASMRAHLNKMREDMHKSERNAAA
jgi:hypothetical protein